MQPHKFTLRSACTRGATKLSARYAASEVWQRQDSWHSGGYNVETLGSDGEHFSEIYSLSLTAIRERVSRWLVSSEGTRGQEGWKDMSCSVCTSGIFRNRG